MVTRNLKQKSKPKTVSNRKNKSLDQIHYGNEPVIEGELKPGELGEILNWYNYMCDLKQGRKWLEDYLRSESRHDDLAMIKKVSDNWISGVVCWSARIISNGTNLDMVWFNEQIKNLYKKQKVTTEFDNSDKPTISIQDRVLKKNKSLCCDVEEMIDSETVDVYNFLLKNEATPSAATYIRDVYQPMYAETLLDDPDVKEGYGKKLKFWQELYKKIIDDCDQYIGNKKAVKVRKPKTIKVKPVTKVVERMNFQKEFGPLRLVSIAPTEIVGATQLWVYNTKSRVLGVYNTTDGATLNVKGSTLINWDEIKSTAKRLRKPDDIVPQLLKAGKIILRSYMDGIKTTSQPVTGRINKDTILLRVQR